MKDNTRCRECAYQTRLSLCGDEPVCFYCGITGKSRMVKCPAGDECTLFSPLGTDIDRRELFFSDDIVSYGWCEDWHHKTEEEDRNNDALYIGFRAYHGGHCGDR